MKRRDFIRKSFAASVASGALFSMGRMNNLMAAEYTGDLPFDIVAVKNGGPSAMFDKAIAAMGGMKQYVKPNQTVVVKPNIGWDSGPERAANTNPELVGRIIKHCIDAGAKKVMVFDNTCDEWTRCYKNSGIEKAVKDNGGQIVTGKTEAHYHPVTIPEGKIMKNNKVHELILESDVFINVPILKYHSGAGITISMKNLMGIVWDRRFWHRNDLNQCIADGSTFRKPDLNIVDAYLVMKRNGPRGVSVDDVVTMKSQIISTDIVAADSASAKLFGMEPSDLSYIKIADEMKIGTMDLSKLNIKRIIL